MQMKLLAGEVDVYTDLTLTSIYSPGPVLPTDGPLMFDAIMEVHEASLKKTPLPPASWLDFGGVAAAIDRLRTVPSDFRSPLMEEGATTWSIGPRVCFLHVFCHHLQSFTSSQNSYSLLMRFNRRRWSKEYASPMKPYEEQVICVLLPRPLLTMLHSSFFSFSMPLLDPLMHRSPATKPSIALSYLTGTYQKLTPQSPTRRSVLTL